MRKEPSGEPEATARVGRADRADENRELSRRGSTCAMAARGQRLRGRLALLRGRAGSLPEDISGHAGVPARVVRAREPEYTLPAVRENNRAFAARRVHRAGG